MNPSYEQAMSAPITKPDYRTKAGREAEVLAQFEIDGRIDWDWINESHSRAAAAKRLIEAGRIKTGRDESMLGRFYALCIAYARTWL